MGDVMNNATVSLKKQLEDMGPISTKEKKALFIFLLTLTLWATGDYQKAWFDLRSAPNRQQF